MLVEERGLKEGLAGPSFSLLNLRQSYFSCKQAKLLPEIKECSGERRVSQNLEWEGTHISHDWQGGCAFVFLFLLGLFLYPMAFFLSICRLSLLWHVPIKNSYLMPAAKSCQSCQTLSDPMDCSLPGSSVYWISRQEYWSGLPLPSPIPCLAYSFVHITPVWKNKLISSPFEVDSVQFICSVVSDSLWPWTAASQASLSITNSQSLLKLMSIELLMPSHHLILLSPSPPAFNLSQHQGFSNESVLRISWPTYWSFSFSISPSNEYSGLISFRIDWFDLLAVWGTLKSLLQHHSSKASILQCSTFLILSHPYMSTGKTIASTKMDLCCLCFLICYLGLS